jgi:hypothetical protein
MDQVVLSRRGDKRSYDEAERQRNVSALLRRTVKRDNDEDDDDDDDDDDRLGGTSRSKDIFLKDAALLIPDLTG